MLETAMKKRNRDEWQRLVASYEASGMTQRAFCVQHDLAYSSFCYWRKQLRTAAAAQDVVPLVELPALASSEPAWRVEVDLGQGVVLRLR
jgi:putative transposase